MVSTLDEKMLSLNEAIQECLEKQEEVKYEYKDKRETTERISVSCRDLTKIRSRRHCRRQCL